MIGEVLISLWVVCLFGDRDSSGDGDSESQGF